MAKSADWANDVDGPRLKMTVHVKHRARAGAASADKAEEAILEVLNKAGGQAACVEVDAGYERSTVHLYLARNLDHADVDDVKHRVLAQLAHTEYALEPTCTGGALQAVEPVR